MITNRSTYFLDVLIETYGSEKGQDLFNRLKKEPPTIRISEKLTNEIIESLPTDFIKFERSEWGLENPDSNCMIEWCEHHYFSSQHIDPSVTILVEVGEHHYFVAPVSDGKSYEGEVVSFASHIRDIISDLILNELKSAKS